MDRTFQGYGPGTNRDDRNRPTGPIYFNQKYAKYNAHFIAPDNGNIYLTFSCGFEHENLTANILDTLLEKNVKAVFFVNMHFTEANPHLIRRIIDEGHILANHCSGHPRLPEKSLDEIVRQIMDMHNYVLEHYGYTMTMFRPPSGYYSEQVLATAQALGYKTVQYSFAYADWETESQPDPVYALNRITSSAHSGAIYLLHAISSTNAAVLGDAIDFFRAEGYTLELYQ